MVEILVIIKLISFIKNLKHTQISDFVEVKVCLWASKEYLNVTELLTKVAIIALTRIKKAPIPIRIGCIKLLIAVNILIENQLWMPQLSCENHWVWDGCTPCRTFQGLWLDCMLFSIKVLVYLMIYQISFRLLSRTLIGLFKECMHLSTNHIFLPKLLF